MRWICCICGGDGNLGGYVRGCNGKFVCKSCIDSGKDKSNFEKKE